METCLNALKYKDTETNLNRKSRNMEFIVESFVNSNNLRLFSIYSFDFQMITTANILQRTQFENTQIL